MLTSNYPPSAFLITILAALASQAASLPITATEISKRELNFGPPARGCVSVTFSLNQKADPLVERMWATAVKPVCEVTPEGREPGQRRSQSPNERPRRSGESIVARLWQLQRQRV